MLRPTTQNVSMGGASTISVLQDTGATCISDILNEETWKESGNNRPAKLFKMKATLAMVNGECFSNSGKNINILTPRKF